MTPSAPAVTCTGCARTWNSPSMVEGLRLMAGCPRCGGELAFAADATARPGDPAVAALEPHLVMGRPRH